MSDFDNFINKEKDDKIKKQLVFAKKIYIYYENKIHSEQQIDFNDMINYAYKKMEKLKEKSLSYDYLIIDEYQDISVQRYNFAKRLSDLFNAKIVAVGDDWQAIFGFSGSDVELFTNFCNLLGYGEIITINQTYRNSQQLIDVAGEFIAKNTKQFQKKLYSKKNLDKPIEIYYYNDNDKVKFVYELIKQMQNEKILIIGRYKNDINELYETGLFEKGKGNKVLCKGMNRNIDFLTAHSSKGLGYDQVILINAINDRRGFPSKIQDEALIKSISDEYVETIEFSEERRLFYVALTRTKNKLYIMCPYEPYNRRSEFIIEISKNHNVKEVYLEENLCKK